MLFLELKLNTKEGTGNERTDWFIFIKFIKKKPRKKKQWNCRREKMRKVKEEMPLTETIKGLLSEITL